MIRAFATDTHLKNNLYASYNALDLLNLKEALDLAFPTYTLPDLVNLSWGSLSCNREAESQVLQVGEHSLLSRHQQWNFHFCWNKKSLTNSNLGEKGFFFFSCHNSRFSSIAVKKSRQLITVTVKSRQQWAHARSGLKDLSTVRLKPGNGNFQQWVGSSHLN